MKTFSMIALVIICAHHGSAAAGASGDDPPGSQGSTPPARPASDPADSPPPIPISSAPGVAPTSPPPPVPPDCEYVSAGVSPVLIRSSRPQRLSLRPATPECGGAQKKLQDKTPLQALANTRVFLKTSKFLIPAQFSNGYITLEYVPNALEDDTRFEITYSVTGPRLGYLQIPAGTITSGKMRVAYTDQALDRLQDTFSREEDNVPIAVVGPTVPPPEPSVASSVPTGQVSHDQKRVRTIHNILRIITPPALPTVSTADDYWVLSDTSWEIEIPWATRLRRGEYRLERVSEIPFIVAQRETRPLRASLSFRHADSSTTYVEWFRVDIQLAKESRFESVPMPISRFLAISCKLRGKARSEPRLRELAIDDDALQTGACSLAFDRNHANQLRYFGRQIIKITVSRSKATSRTRTWELDVDSREIPLFPPDDDDRGEGPYRIFAEVSVSDNQAVYRTGVPILLSASANGARSDYTFTASLQPRGAYATFARSRLYVTFPVDILAMRFPAVMRYVDHSSDGSTVQLSGLRTGIQLVWEPWDYARRRNSSPVPFRLLVGVNAFEVLQKRFAPSLVAGAALVLGTLGEKIPSSVTIGVFYELDLVEPRRGSHVLITSTVNFLSLFGK